MWMPVIRVLLASSPCKGLLRALSARQGRLLLLSHLLHAQNVKRASMQNFRAMNSPRIAACVREARILDGRLLSRTQLVRPAPQAHTPAWRERHHLPSAGIALQEHTLVEWELKILRLACFANPESTP